MNTNPFVDRENINPVNMSNSSRASRMRRFVIIVGILFIFMRVLYNGPSSSTSSSSDSSSASVPPNNNYPSTGLTSLDAALVSMQNKAGNQIFPQIISAVYRGSWQLDFTSPITRERDPLAVSISGPKREEGKLNLQHFNGDTTMQLLQEDTIFNEIKKIRGIMRIYDGPRTDSNSQAYEFDLRGSYIMPAGLITVYGNSLPEDQITLLWNRSATIPKTYLHIEDEIPSHSLRRQLLKIIQMECTLRLDLQLEPINGDIQDNRQIDFNGIITSNNCHDFAGLNITSTAKIINERTVEKASNYAIIATCLAFAQISLTMRQMAYGHTPAALNKISIITLWQQAMLDCYLSLIHIFGAVLWENVFPAFAICAFVELILCKVFELRYMLTVWHAGRDVSQNEDTNVYHRDIRNLYTRFYLMLMIGIFAIYEFFDYINLFVFIFYSFWVPQIIFNVRHDIKKPFDNKYLLGMTLWRTIIPSYFYLCPKSWLNEVTEFKGDVNFGIILNAWLIIQVAMLLTQQYLGPRFFIPSMFLPKKYNYHRHVVKPNTSSLNPASHFLVNIFNNSRNNNYTSVSPVDEEEGDVRLDCVICVGEVSLLSPSEYMLTPCDHFFHKSCLEQWMAVKMECPVCRASLPTP